MEVLTVFCRVNSETVAAASAGTSRVETSPNDITLNLRRMSFTSFLGL